MKQQQKEEPIKAGAWGWLLVAIAALLLASLLKCDRPAHALTITGSAPIFGDSSHVCSAPRLVNKAGAPVVWYVRLETAAGATIWTDSVTTLMGNPFTFQKPDPAPGSYKIRSWGRRPLSIYGCDSTVSLTVLDRVPPGRNNGLIVTPP